MAIIALIDAVVILSLLWSGRQRLERALPVFAFILTLIPYESRLVLPGLPDLTTERLAVITLALMFLTRRERTETQPIPFRNLMLVHIAWVACSTAFSLSISTSVKQMLSQLVEYYVLYFILVRLISTTETAYKIVYSMMIALAICSIFAIGEVYGSWSVLRIFPANLWTTYDGGHDPLYIEWGRGLRVRSTFPHPILFGDALAMGIPLTLYLLSSWARGYQRVTLWFGLILMFWAIYRTSSRGPWMALIGSLAMLAFLIQGKVSRYLAAICVMAVVVLATRPGVWPTIQNLYESTMSSSNPIGSSYEFRGALNAAVEEAVQKDPVRMLLGYGIGTFRELGLDIQFLNGVHRWFTCDNNWAAFLYETGYGGLLIVGSLLGCAWLRTAASYQKLPKPQRYFCGVILINFGAFYFLLMSVAGYGWGQQGFMLWILIAISVAYPAAVQREQREAIESATARSEMAEKALSPMEAWAALRNTPSKYQA